MSVEENKSNADLAEFYEGFGLTGFGIMVRTGFENAGSEKEDILRLVEMLSQDVSPEAIKEADPRLPLGRYSEPKTPEEIPGIGKARTTELLKKLQVLNKEKYGGKLDKVVLAFALAVEAFEVTTLYDKRAAFSQFRNLRP